MMVHEWNANISAVCITGQQSQNEDTNKCAGLAVSGVGVHAVYIGL